MRLGLCAAVAVVAGVAGGAAAQFVTTPGITANLSLGWMEDPAFASNNNGVLEPGERALILLNVSFTGLGTTASFAPGINQYHSGTIMGMGSLFIDIKSSSADPSGLYNNGITSPASSSIGPNADSSGSTGYGVRSGWRILGSPSNGQPVANGFVHIQPGQFISDPGLVNPADPITNIDRLGWAPTSYAPRTVTFGTNGNTEAAQQVMGLLLDANGLGTTVVVAYIPVASITFGTVDIPIAPAPGGLAILTVGGLMMRRRSR